MKSSVVMASGSCQKFVYFFVYNNKLGTNWVQNAKKEKPRFLESGLFRAYNMGDPPRGRTENLLIKSQAFFVHRRVPQFTAGTILRLNAKTVRSGQK